MSANPPPADTVPSNGVTEEQVDALQGAIVAALHAYSNESGARAYYEGGTAGRYWFMEAAFISAGAVKFLGKNGPTRNEYKPLAILDMETRRFVKGSINKKGVRIAKAQPKNPPTIDDYALSRLGVVEGVGYPEHVYYRVVFSQGREVHY
jgi:hypothetical protein